MRYIFDSLSRMKSNRRESS